MPLVCLRRACDREETDDFVYAQVVRLFAWKRAGRHRDAQSGAERLAKRAPTHVAVRAALLHPEIRLVPLVRAQLLLFGAHTPPAVQCAPRARPKLRRARRPCARPATRSVYLCFQLIAPHVANLATLRALCCVNKDCAMAVEGEWSRTSPFDVRPLCWCDALAAARRAISVRLSCGTLVRTRRMIADACGGAIVDQNSDVFEIMLRSLIWGHSGGRLYATDDDDARAVDVRWLISDPAASTHGWIAAYGYAFAASRIDRCEEMLAWAPCGVLELEARRLLRALHLP